MNKIGGKSNRQADRQTEKKKKKTSHSYLTLQIFKLAGSKYDLEGPQK